MATLGVKELRGLTKLTGKYSVHGI